MDGVAVTPGDGVALEPGEGLALVPGLGVALAPAVGVVVGLADALLLVEGAGVGFPEAPGEAEAEAPVVGAGVGLGVGTPTDTLLVRVTAARAVLSAAVSVASPLNNGCRTWAVSPLPARVIRLALFGLRTSRPFVPARACSKLTRFCAT